MMNGLSRRDLGRLSAGLALASMFGGTAIAAVPAASQAAADPYALVNPELRALLHQLEQQFGSAPPLTDEVVRGLRSMRFPGPPLLSEVPVAVQTIPGLAGAPGVRIHVINATAGGARPGILHTHGGGYVMGSPNQDIPLLQRLARTLDCAVVTVEYRLAPETRYSGSIDDNYAGLKWMHDHAAELGVDPRRIAVMGESAGGGHAALLAIAARDRGEVPLALQVLIYPMLDDRTGSSRPVSPNIGQFMWKADSNRYGWRSFLGQAPGGASVPAAGVPARVQNLAGLPPTFIGVGSIDLFVDEDLDYARRLIDAGVQTELVVAPGAFHGFDVIAPDTGVAQRFAAAKVDALRRAFAAAGRA